MHGMALLGAIVGILHGDRPLPKWDLGLSLLSDGNGLEDASCLARKLSHSDSCAGSDLGPWLRS
jgi:hypothetical protein